MATNKVVLVEDSPVALIMRQTVRYCMGGCPTKSVNRAANVDRDIDTCSAREATVQAFSGDRCISDRATTISVSAILRTELSGNRP